MARKKPSRLNPPSWLRKDCRKRWAELLEEFGSDDLKPMEFEALGRLAHVSSDLEAAEALVAVNGSIATCPNGTRHISAEAKLRDTLSAEFRSLLKLLEKRKPVPKADQTGAIVDRIRGILARRQSAGERQQAANIKRAELAAQDRQREFLG